MKERSNLGRRPFCLVIMRTKSPCYIFGRNRWDGFPDRCLGDIALVVTELRTAVFSAPIPLSDACQAENYSLVAINEGNVFCPSYVVGKESSLELLF